MTRPMQPLPEPAATYLRNRAPSLKPNSLSGHRVVLRKFHKWLAAKKVPFEQLSRDHICTWFVNLHKAGLVPKSLNHHIIFTRLYLRWLYEQGLLSRFPDELIRTSDLVKEPKYLPRPLPPETDKILQERLAKDGEIYALGLLLMRKTGIRNGELRALDVNCIRTDLCGNHFLKVPLGKLDSERFVPLDLDTRDLVLKLRGDDNTAAEKVFLIETQSGKKTRYSHYQQKIKCLAEGLNLNGRIGTHRLRHTFATNLLDAGMSLVGIMKLLGHTDHRMTLRYTDISQQTLGDEYFRALAKLEHRYQVTLGLPVPSASDPIKAIDDVIHLLTKIGLDDVSHKTYTRTLTKKLTRIQANIQELLRSTELN